MASKTEHSSGTHGKGQDQDASGEKGVSQENGCPHGRDVELWEQAEDLVAIEENPQAGLLPNPGDKDPARAGVEEAEIQDNYGEIPGRLTDQGERPQTPAKHNLPE